jgi:triosephosphate isomerase
MRTKLVVGNWKMNGTVKETRKLLFQLAVEWGKHCEGVDVVVCPPFTALSVAKQELNGSNISLGAQNCYSESKGAFTGEISPAMLVDLGCTYVILGHSERRTIFSETDDHIARKSRAAVDAGLIPIVCIGETERERADNQTEQVLSRQILGSLSSMTVADRFVVAYEPVWAIGTGKTATPEQAEAAQAFIRSELKKKFGQAAEDILILYGGSMKPSNAKELFACANIDGGLIGGASLVADDFIAIIDAGA